MLMFLVTFLVYWLVNSGDTSEPEASAKKGTLSSTGVSAAALIPHHCPRPLVRGRGGAAGGADCAPRRSAHGMRSWPFICYSGRVGAPTHAWRKRQPVWALYYPRSGSCWNGKITVVWTATVTYLGLPLSQSFSEHIHVLIHLTLRATPRHSS